MTSLASKFAAAFIAAAAAVGPAAADDVSFAFSRSDLASSSAVSGLYEKIRERSDSACSLYQNSGLLGVEYRKACASALTDELIAGIDDQRLTSLHEERHSARFSARD